MTISMNTLAQMNGDIRNVTSTQGYIYRLASKTTVSGSLLI